MQLKVALGCTPDPDEPVMGIMVVMDGFFGRRQILSLVTDIGKGDAGYHLVMDDSSHPRLDRCPIDCIRKYHGIGVGRGPVFDNVQ